VSLTRVSLPRVIVEVCESQVEQRLDDCAWANCSGNFMLNLCLMLESVNVTEGIQLVPLLGPMLGPCLTKVVLIQSPSFLRTLLEPSQQFNQLVKSGAVRVLETVINARYLGRLA
jgi:hypothetical protein